MAILERATPAEVCDSIKAAQAAGEAAGRVFAESFEEKLEVFFAKLESL